MKRKIKAVDVLFVLAFLMLVSSVVFAQGTFPVGKVGEVRALMCFEKDTAALIAKLGQTNHPLVNQLALNGHCAVVHGFGQYIKKVADEGAWAVWEVDFGGHKLYEATNWKREGDI